MQQLTAAASTVVSGGGGTILVLPAEGDAIAGAMTVAADGT